jgi:hypothetical protein
MKHLLIVAAAMVATAGGCVSDSDMIGKLRPRAAFDLACPEQQVDVKLLDGKASSNASYGATGCGKRVRYETFCDNQVLDQCQVRAQSIDAEGPAAGQPAAPDPAAPAAPAAPPAH